MPALARTPAARTALLFAVLVAAGHAQGQTQAPPAEPDDHLESLPRVVVGAGQGGRAAFDAPASLGVVGREVIESAGPGVNLSEALARVPGVRVLDRQNYAQDLQIQSRGYGARSTFGVRGVRLYADGIPLTMPDGQGQSSSFALDSAQRIEVLSGPFSALYGNAAGGVVQVYTEDGPRVPMAAASLRVGSRGLRKAGIKAGGTRDGVSVLVDASNFETDGWRDHAAASRDQLNAKLRWQMAPGRRLTVLANYLNMPRVQDPLGLTRAQLQADPRGVDPVALQYDTRKAIENAQVGAVLEAGLGRHELRLMAYAGTRAVTQFQSIPPTNQIPERSAGGVIDFARRYQGMDLRDAVTGTWLGGTLQTTFGVAVDAMSEDRRGYENFTGPAATPAALGVRGNLRRNEDNTVRSLGGYLQTQWIPDERWDLTAGLRYTHVAFETEDRFVAGINGDDSGRTSFEAVRPFVGATHHLNERVNLYASFGTSFETPTLNETAYRPDGEPGPNLALRPSRGRHLELGMKTRWASGARLDVALFHVATRDEIGVYTNSGGRSTFQNVGRTQRVGFELAGQAELAPRWMVHASATHVLARYRDAFRTCTAAPCTTSSTTNTAIVPGGSRIPGIARQVLYGEVEWRATPELRAAAELRWSSRVPVDDLNRDAASPHALAALRLSWSRSFGPVRLDALARVDNLFDRRYVGSVIVNEGNGRYFEPGAGRSWLLGLTVGRAF